MRRARADLPRVPVSPTIEHDDPRVLLLRSTITIVVRIISIESIDDLRCEVNRSTIDETTVYCSIGQYHVDFISLRNNQRSCTMYLYVAC